METLSTTPLQVVSFKDLHGKLFPTYEAALKSNEDILARQIAIQKDKDALLILESHFTKKGVLNFNTRRCAENSWNRIKDLQHLIKLVYHLL